MSVRRDIRYQRSDIRNRESDVKEKQLKSDPAKKRSVSDIWHLISLVHKQKRPEADGARS
jgi:hypothetical protein